MDWDLKIPSWDLAELDRSTEPNISSVMGTSRSLGRWSSGLDCSIDLKLGGLGDFASSGKWKDQSKVSVKVSPSGSSKRARAPSNVSQNASCLVDGCKSDLRNYRDYHRRHKVCADHSKTPMVMVGGQEQRFCQQCSRFHLLVEFDEVKRSCRKRLDGHNRRRRKPQPDAMNSGSMFQNHQGPKFPSFPPIFPPTTPETHWTAAVVKMEEDALYSHHPPLQFLDRQQHFPGTFSGGSYKAGKQFPFLQDSDNSLSNRAALETSVCQPLLNSIASSESGSSRKMFSDGLTQVLDSDCALSLLSSPSPILGINLSHVVHADRIPMAQPMVPTPEHYGGLSRYSQSQSCPSNHVSVTGLSCSVMEDDDEQAGTVLVSDDNDDSVVHFHGIFHGGGGHGPSNGSPQGLPFPWHQ